MVLLGYYAFQRNFNFIWVSVMARLALNKIKFDMGDKENVWRGSKINENRDKNCFHNDKSAFGNRF